MQTANSAAMVDRVDGAVHRVVSLAAVTGRLHVSNRLCNSPPWREVLICTVRESQRPLFVVRQTQQALVVRFGEPVRVVTEAGLNFKAPFVDTVISIDKRILDLENPSQEIIASDQKRLMVMRLRAIASRTRFASIRASARCRRRTCRLRACSTPRFVACAAR